MVKFKISSYSHTSRGIKTFVGHAHYYENKKFLYSESTGIHRLTPKTAHKDAYGLVYDFQNRQLQKIFKNKKK